MFELNKNTNYILLHAVYRELHYKIPLKNCIQIKCYPNYHPVKNNKINYNNCNSILRSVIS